MEVNKLYKLISQTEHYSAVPVYCTSIKILVAKKKDHPHKDISNTGIIKDGTMQIAKLSNLCSKNVLNYHEPKLQEKQVLSVFCLSVVRCKQVLLYWKSEGS